MNIGEKVNIRCPQCKNSNLLLHEGFMVYTTREIEKGCVVELTRPAFLNLLGSTQRNASEKDALTAGRYVQIH